MLPEGQTRIVWPTGGIKTYFDARRDLFVNIRRRHFNAPPDREHLRVHHLINGPGLVRQPLDIRGASIGGDLDAGPRRGQDTQQSGPRLVDNADHLIGSGMLGVHDGHATGSADHVHQQHGAAGHTVDNPRSTEVSHRLA